ncbi:MAG TPA: hypothetical protein VFF11_13360, partial [Candidatus Binatia bacterium]|nr:hypothetical protein [Candidatus Binatia bacterium]
MLIEDVSTPVPAMRKLKVDGALDGSAVSAVSQESQESDLAVAPPVAILGVVFDNVTATEALRRMEEMIASRRPHYIATANVDFLAQARSDAELRRILMDADLVLCDGTPLV